MTAGGTAAAAAAAGEATAIAGDEIRHTNFDPKIRLEHVGGRHTPIHFFSQKENIHL